MFFSEADGLYAVAADNINNAGEMFSRIILSLRSETNRTSGAIFQCIHAAVCDYHRARVQREVITKYLLIPGDLEKEENVELVRDECMRFDSGCEMVIGAFDELGRALLFETYSVGYTEQDNGLETLVLARGNTIPGFAAIGKGVTLRNFGLTTEITH
jgi:hypothetical protein